MQYKYIDNYQTYIYYVMLDNNKHGDLFIHKYSQSQVCFLREDIAVCRQIKVSMKEGYVCIRKQHKVRIRLIPFKIFNIYKEYIFFQIRKILLLYENYHSDFPNRALPLAFLSSERMYSCHSLLYNSLFKLNFPFYDRKYRQIQKRYYYSYQSYDSQRYSYGIK